MKARLNIGLISPAAYRAMVGLEHFTIQQSSIEPKLVHLLKMCAWQALRRSWQAAIDSHHLSASSDPS